MGEEQIGTGALSLDRATGALRLNVDILLYYPGDSGKIWLITRKRSVQSAVNSYAFPRTSVGCLWPAHHAAKNFIPTSSWARPKKEEPATF
jgi:hypothetical protein